MALARIITQNPEDLAEVREALRRRGYWVEVVSAAEAPSSVAELEIIVHRAGFEQALALARESGADVLIAPDVVPKPAPAAPQPSKSLAAPPPIPAPPV